MPRSWRPANRFVRRFRIEACVRRELAEDLGVAPATPPPEFVRHEVATHPSENFPLFPRAPAAGFP